MYKPSTEGLCILQTQHILSQCLMTPLSLVMSELFSYLSASFTTTIYTVTAPQIFPALPDNLFL